MQLKNTLGRVYSNANKLFHGRLPRLRSRRPHLGTQMPCGGRPPQQGYERALATLDSRFPGCVKTRLESEMFAIRVHLDSLSIPRRLGNKEFSHSLDSGHPGPPARSRPLDSRFRGNDEADAAYYSLACARSLSSRITSLGRCLKIRALRTPGPSSRLIWVKAKKGI